MGQLLMDETQYAPIMTRDSSPSILDNIKKTKEIIKKGQDKNKKLKKSPVRKSSVEDPFIQNDDLYPVDSVVNIGK